MGHFKFRYFDGVLCIQKTELQFFTYSRVRLKNSQELQIAHMTFGAWCETVSFIMGADNGGLWEASVT